MARNSARAVACELLVQVIAQGRSLSQIEHAAFAQLPDARERGLARELVYGVLRWHEQLDFFLSHLLQKPFKAKDSDVLAVLLLGIYQLEYTRIPPHASLDTSVEMARVLKKDWAAKLINAVLRNYQRRREALWAKQDECARYSHPQWLINAMREAWPQHWQALLAANNERGPMTLRVNLSKHSRDEFIAQLAALGIAADVESASATAVRLREPVDVTQLPGFAQGSCTVQDQAAQFAAPLLQVQAGQRVLDACAAPGGKTSHLLEGANAPLLALEKEAPRLQRLRENLARFDGAAQVTSLQADAADTATWWDGTPFDRILLDAPCSGSGVIRRNPDIKILRKASDIAMLAAQQRRLLEALWPLLRPGGVLLYATCSVLPQENEQQIAQFVAAHGDARADLLDLPCGHPTGHGLQLLTGENQMDGFFYARLRKNR